MKKENKEKEVGKLRKTIRNFYPTYIYDKVEHIPYELIEELGIKMIILDMDNTLIDNKHTYSNELKEWAKNMKANGVELYILSNSPFGKVVQKIAKELGMKYIHKANKPSTKGFKKIESKMNIEKKNILMVGDQLFTDVWGGNRYGIKTILVKPIKTSETILTKVKRPFEKIVLKHYLKKKGGI